jgi:hypothetical protein
MPGRRRPTPWTAQVTRDGVRRASLRDDDGPALGGDRRYDPRRWRSSRVAASTSVAWWIMTGHHHEAAADQFGDEALDPTHRARRSHRPRCLANALIDDRRRAPTRARRRPTGRSRTIGLIKARLRRRTSCTDAGDGKRRCLGERSAGQAPILSGNEDDLSETVGV